MSGRPKKAPRKKDLTSQFIDGEFEDDRIDSVQRFGDRSKHFQRDKTQRTAELRADLPDINALPIGQIVQVYSLYCDLEFEGKSWLCLVRKTLTKTSEGIVVGDFARFRDVGTKSEQGRSEGVIEQVLPRKTVLTRADSFKQQVSHPIVANAQQMLIVVATAEPNPKWGLVDRMIVAARSGGLDPVLCLNKMDLIGANHSSAEAIAYYGSIGLRTLQTSQVSGEGIQLLREVLKDRTTVLAGHSGVGKSSLISAAEPAIDLRVGEISRYTGKGKHTTTSARWYSLASGGAVIDTPGVKMFGLWGVTKENLEEFFADVVEGNAPDWRRESYERIARTIGK